MKLPLAHRLNDICPQHQITHVGCRDHDSLPTGQALHTADIKKPLDLFVHAANGLHLAPLVHRACHGEVLAQGQLRQAREQGVQFGRGRTVPFHARVRLLETQASGQGEGLVLAIAIAHIARQDQQALVMNRAAEPGLALDVDKTGLAHGNTGGDPGRSAEGVVP